LFASLAKAHVVIDMISQHIPKADNLDITFSLDRGALTTALAAIRDAFPDDAPCVDVNDAATKLVISGPGMEHQAGVTAKLFKTLAVAGIEVCAVTTSETQIACCVRDADTEEAKQAIMSAFSL
jgi:aspartokinase